MGRSVVWSFCVPLDARRVQCHLCHTDLAYCGNTTNFRRHIQEKHTKVFEDEVNKGKWQSHPDLYICQVMRGVMHM